MTIIDLNSDLGEGFGAWSMGDDQAMLAMVSSANIACGFHAGDPHGLYSTLQCAQVEQVRIGAHISYPDRVGFGRRFMDVTYSELFSDALYQIAALDGLAKSVGSQVSYVKPHGALYNTIAQGHAQAQAVIDAILSYDASLALMTRSGSPLVEQAQQHGLSVIQEIFADRAYQADGQLVPRSKVGAVFDDPAIISQRLMQFIDTGHITSIDGKVISLNADSICIHGDTPNAVFIAQSIYQTLTHAGIQFGASHYL